MKLALIAALLTSTFAATVHAGVIEDLARTSSTVTLHGVFDGR